MRVRAATSSYASFVTVGYRYQYRPPSQRRMRVNARCYAGIKAKGCRTWPRRCARQAKTCNSPPAVVLQATRGSLKGKQVGAYHVSQRA